MITDQDWQDWEIALAKVQAATNEAMAIGRRIMTDGAPPALDDEVQAN